MPMYDMTKAERAAIVNLLKVTAHADRERAKMLDRQAPRDQDGYDANRAISDSFFAQAEERRALAFKLEEQ